MTHSIFTPLPPKRTVRSGRQGTIIPTTYTRSQPLSFPLLSKSVFQTYQNRDWTLFDPEKLQGPRDRKIRQLVDLFQLLSYRNYTGDAQRCAKILRILIRCYEFPTEDFWSHGLLVIDLDREHQWRMKVEKLKRRRLFRDQEDQDQDREDQDEDENENENENEEIFSEQDLGNESSAHYSRDMFKKEREEFDMETSKIRLRYLKTKFQRERSLQQILLKDIIMEYIFRKEYQEAFDFLELHINDKRYKPNSELHCLFGLLVLFLGFQPHSTIKSTASSVDFDDLPTFPHHLPRSLLSELPRAILVNAKEHFVRGLESREVMEWSFYDRSRLDRILIWNDEKKKKMFKRELRRAERVKYGVGNAWTLGDEDDEASGDDEDDDDDDETEEAEVRSRLEKRMEERKSKKMGKGKKGKRKRKTSTSLRGSDQDSLSSDQSQESDSNSEESLDSISSSNSELDSEESIQSEEDEKEGEDPSNRDPAKSKKRSIPNTEVLWSEELCRIYVDLINQILDSQPNSQSLGGFRSNSQPRQRSASRSRGPTPSQSQISSSTKVPSGLRFGDESESEEDDYEIENDDEEEEEVNLQVTRNSRSRSRSRGPASSPTSNRDRNPQAPKVRGGLRFGDESDSEEDGEEKDVEIHANNNVMEEYEVEEDDEEDEMLGNLQSDMEDLEENSEDESD